MCRPVPKPWGWGCEFPESAAITQGVPLYEAAAAGGGAQQDCQHCAQGQLGLHAPHLAFLSSIVLLDCCYHCDFCLLPMPHNIIMLSLLFFAQVIGTVIGSGCNTCVDRPLLASEC